jgi:hypothetical protein
MTPTILRIAAGIMLGLGIGARRLHAAGDAVSACLTDVHEDGLAAAKAVAAVFVVKAGTKRVAVMNPSGTMRPSDAYLTRRSTVSPCRSP